MKKINQSGIAALWIIALILIGIGSGTWLIQNRTNFLPKAQEQETISAGPIDETGTNCTQPVLEKCEGNILVKETWEWNEVGECQLFGRRQNNPISCPTEPTSPNENPPAQQPETQTPAEAQPIAPPPPEVNTGVSDSKINNCQDEACKNKACESDKVIYCDNRDGRPRAIRKTGGYFDSSTGKCIFDFFEVPEKNNECSKSESKSGDVVSVTADEERRIDQNRSSTQASRSQGGSSSTSSSSAACSTDPKINSATETSFKDAKVANNLVRFYSILEGLPSMCVPADLGVGNQEKASAGGKEGRLMLCSGADSTLTWRVIIDNKLVVPDNKPAPQKDQIITGFTESGKLKAARIAAGLENP